MAHHSDPTTDELEAVRAFVNSVHYEQGAVDERLDSPEALAVFLEGHELTAGRVAARPADLRRALEVREALRALMGANNGQELDRDAIEVLNRAAARSRVVAAFDDNASWRIEPAAGGVDQGLGRMLAAVLRAMSDGTWQRMKACGNPDCRWAFYDATKNRSGRWCDMASCGNRMKARAFRERSRAKAKRP
jgi:predicted RNA-binding Zn ribbon-like protein